MMGPPFTSVHQGMEFAFANAPGCGSNWPNMASARASSGLSRLDVRAQAGQIQSVIERLGPVERQWILLGYGPADGAMGHAVGLVPYVIAGLPSGLYPTRLIAELILWNCGRREYASMSLRQIAQRSGWSVWKTAKLSARIGHCVQAFGVRAFEALEQFFDEHEWLASKK